MLNKATKMPANKNNELISVIVPVYNAQDFIGLCIESVLKQSYSNLELILVDDGSTDESSLVCTRYVKKDKRIKLVSGENRGVSKARNIGLGLARGMYITFIDSDDVVDPNYLERLYSLAQIENAEIVTCKHIKFDNNKKIPHTNIQKNVHKVVGKNTACLNLLYQKNTDNCVFAKLYRCDVVKGIRFNEKSIYTEDLEFNYKVFLVSEKFVFSNAVLYFYRNHPDSAVNQPYSSKRISGLKVAESIYNATKKEHKAVRKAAGNKLFIKSSQLLTEIPDHLVVYKEHCWKNIKQLRLLVLLDRRSRIRYRFYACMSFMGKSLYVKMNKIKTKYLAS
jgi:glycosyltransferase involved in cell wall biosynthesis